MISGCATPNVRNPRMDILEIVQRTHPLARRNQPEQRTGEPWQPRAIPVVTHDAPPGDARQSASRTRRLSRNALSPAAVSV